MPAAAYGRVLEALGEPALLVRADGRVEACNAALGRALGRPRESLVGADWHGSVRDPEAAGRLLREGGRSRAPVLGAVELVTPGGAAAFRAEAALVEPATSDAPALLLVRLEPRRAAAREFLELNRRVEALRKEVVRRTQAEAALERQREWLEVTLASIGDAVVATDVEGRVTFMNPVAAALTHWDAGEALGQPLAAVLRLVHEETRTPCESPVARVLRTGSVQGLAHHTMLLARDGTEVVIDDAAAPIRLPDGRIVGVVLVFRDVRARRRLERELQARAETLAERDRRKDEFLAMLAHELRNPLAPIAAAAALLRTAPPAPEVQAQAAALVERQLAQIVRLLDDLLDASRVTMGRIGLRRERMDLGSVLRGATDAVSDLVRVRGHALAVELPPDPVHLYADPVRLTQVFANLLANAAKYTEHGGHLGVGVARGADGVTVTVSDDGAGIAAEDLGRIFDLFVQVDVRTDRRHGGLGIGLTLARDLVALHGGTLTAYSDGTGRGSRFVVHLPPETVLGPEPAPAPPPAPVPAPPMRVLVVDDNPDSALALRWVLEAQGHDVATAHDGAGALAAAAAHAPDVILLDIGLPGMDGYELCRRLRGDARFARTIIVAQTGWGQAEHLQRSREAGFDHHLVKPVDLAELARLLREAAASRA